MILGKDYDEKFRLSRDLEIDFKAILEWGINNGIEYYAIEIDSYQGDMFKALEASLAYLKDLYADIIINE
ncbi:MAG: hypothetical protein ACRCTA_05040 [Bacilli bacterium]